MKAIVKYCKANKLSLFVVAGVALFAVAAHFFIGLSAFAGVALAGMPAMGALAWHTPHPFEYSFKSVVSNALVGYEGCPVMGVAQTDGSVQIQLWDGSSRVLGILKERLEGSQAWRVSMRGPVVKVRATAAITALAFVNWGSSVAGGQAPAATYGVASVSSTGTSTNYAVGIAIAAATAAGDFIPVMMFDSYNAY